MILSTPQTQAQLEARRTWEANRTALARQQPRLAAALDAIACEVEWVYARDGALTGLDAQGRFLGGCSVPRLAAGEMLRKMNAAGVVCFLRPTHAAQLRAALQRLRPRQAVIAIVPDLPQLRLMLHCDDLAGSISGNRLWFAAGDKWADGLRELLESHPGLPLPQQFLRTPELIDEDANLLTQPAQAVFAQVAQQRNALQARLLAEPTPADGQLCLLAGSRFGLWDDAGAVLAHVLRGQAVRLVDVDDPACAGSLALLLASRGCSAVLAVNATRAELAEAVSAHTPIISWLTVPAIPRFQPAMSRDALLMADGRWVELAQALGWPASRIAEAEWIDPDAADGSRASPGVVPAHLAIIADTTDLAVPEAVQLSTHQLLWEQIARELTQDPFALGDDPEQYLRARRRRAGIGDDGFDATRFLEELIVPAYAQGVAGALLDGGIRLEIHGAGWAALARFAAAAHGPVFSRRQVQDLARAAAGLVHVWPSGWAHPIEALGRPLVRAWGSRNRNHLITQAKRLLAGHLPCESLPRPLTADTIRAMVRK